ncbi:sodium:proton antiporter [Peloplasma aerotolerans]|jgi:multicomponent Na+:H+ antiporter subunit C|uniref:Cation:proton antiporter subunit C n=1 Tax=Peloplasma aerotolerans TaxID=3044389 RepID=A0AAW6U996_9MOLU|nr:cation:proton antiporter subunit C [Mariniplasma sp. M4Ah]MDI6453027.1 cation:proton antiporter subunit C [Mariniplasma sp. M4Ah]
MNPILSFIVILVGVYGLATSRNIIKSVFCVTIIEAGLILLFLNFGVYEGGVIPILTAIGLDVVDPLPQALMITTIVIGSTITSMALMLCIKIFHHYGTIEWKTVLKGDK